MLAVSSVIVLQVETTCAVEPKIETGGDAFWWGFVTTTTVGYGDSCPTTAITQLWAMVLMTMGMVDYQAKNR
jgi:voltage-gated potassium channel